MLKKPKPSGGTEGGKEREDSFELLSTPLYHCNDGMPTPKTDENGALLPNGLNILSFPHTRQVSFTCSVESGNTEHVYDVELLLVRCDPSKFPSLPLLYHPDRPVKGWENIPNGLVALPETPEVVWQIRRIKIFLEGLPVHIEAGWTSAGDFYAKPEGANYDTDLKLMTYVLKGLKQAVTGKRSKGRSEGSGTIPKSDFLRQLKQARMRLGKGASQEEMAAEMAMDVRTFRRYLDRYQVDWDKVKWS